MKEIINVYKPAGWSLTGTIEVWKNKHPEYKNASITFAGRLDPLAEGVLLLLCGDAIKRKDEFLGLDKTYEATFLFGFETDTFDILGISKKVGHQEPDYEDIKTAIESLRGTIKLKIPAYASVPINGTPLFELARNNALEGVDIPEREMKISEAQVLGFTDMNNQKLLEAIERSIEQVVGDFRQNEITDVWRDQLKKPSLYALASAKISCSSGTYIRSLADHIGKQLGTGAALFSLKRTSVGDYNIEDSEALQ